MEMNKSRKIQRLVGSMFITPSLITESGTLKRKGRRFQHIPYFRHPFACRVEESILRQSLSELESYIFCSESPISTSNPGSQLRVISHTVRTTPHHPSCLDRKSRQRLPGNGIILLRLFGRFEHFDRGGPFFVVGRGVLLAPHTGGG